MERIFSDIIERDSTASFIASERNSAAIFIASLSVKSKNTLKNTLTTWRGIQPALLPDGDYLISGDHQPSWLSLQRTKKPQNLAKGISC